jgi:hypothetical protein
MKNIVYILNMKLISNYRHGHAPAKISKSPTIREYLKGKYHCTIDLLFDWFGLVCFANKNKNNQLSYSWFQTSQTGGQWYSDTSPFSIPCQLFTKETFRSSWKNMIEF